MERGFSLFRDDRPLAGPPTGHCTPFTANQTKHVGRRYAKDKDVCNDSSCDWAESEHSIPASGRRLAASTDASREAVGQAGNSVKIAKLWPTKRFAWFDLLCKLAKACSSWWNIERGPSRPSAILPFQNCGHVPAANHVL
ncbi:hypothetical protein CCM_00264 [Cordyceps militaris CM01]|uniref:Uncharacterized protein n=1 Tax=Cordyceps militaris (strain CM01) TaxID=983644 RepID=G3J327_CORMM|nr:uncharacterized protein CCM_00264 [Cordyceps militaris CM01]EGX95610.1 hypothetical protein CCM_00264 [Cordyceps militaris CM01]